MKSQADRWIILPFSMSCVSESSICIGGGREKGITKRSSSSSSVRTKQKSEPSFPSQKPSTTCGFRFHRLIKNLSTNISQLFAYKGDEEEEEEEVEMKIGLPTDVKHLTHIGWDGSTTTINTISNSNSSSINQHHSFKGWEDNNSSTVKLPSISLKQFEMAMAAQTDQHNQNLSPNSNSNSGSSNTMMSETWSPVCTDQNNSVPANLVVHQ